MTNKRAALYVRVSTDHQSVENQIRDLRHVAVSAVSRNQNGSHG
jgi:DNA invertase Pin-like site-specific DNA recombinase